VTQVIAINMQLNPRKERS